MGESDPQLTPGRDGSSVSEAFAELTRNPHTVLFRNWNWKCALFSSLLRASLFFFVNLTTGLHRAFAAMLTELVFRGITAGWYGSLTQAFRKVRPAWKAMATLVPVLIVFQHSLEFLVHRLRGTPRLTTSIAASIGFTILSTLVNLALVRKGKFLVGDGAGSLLDDLAALPRLLGGAFAQFGVLARRMTPGLNEEA